MSARVAQIIEIIEEILGDFYDNRQQTSISQLRIKAVRSVADRRGITTNSVADKFIRQLSPEITSTSQFDALLKNWLINKSMELRDTILKHAVDSHDRQLITSSFLLTPPEDKLIAKEFDFDTSDAAFQEGRKQLGVHLSNERNKHLIAHAKKIWIQNDELRCSICSFSFSVTYGEVGEGYIEAHHIIPISELTENTIVRPSDLAPVCSNCHGIIHRHRPWLTIEQMRVIVSKLK
jgi:predicted HNH restriction endonuclease